MTAMQERLARKRVNSDLYDLGQRYHDSLPIESIDATLARNGFSETEPAIYCGRDGQAHAQVGERSYLTISWHKMESGRYEVVSYLS